MDGFEEGAAEHVEEFQDGAAAPQEDFQGFGERIFDMHWLLDSSSVIFAYSFWAMFSSGD